MQSRIFDLLLGLAVSNDSIETFIIQAIIALVIFLIAQPISKFFVWVRKTLWLKFIQTLAKEIKKLNE